MKITMLQNKIIMDGEMDLYFTDYEKSFIKLESDESNYNYRVEIKNFHIVGVKSKFKFIRKLKKIYHILKEG